MNLPPVDPRLSPDVGVHGHRDLAPRAEATLYVLAGASLRRFGRVRCRTSSFSEKELFGTPQRPFTTVRRESR